jgi:hypothetical protein
MQLKPRHTIRDDWKMFGKKVSWFTCIHTYLLVIFGTRSLRSRLTIDSELQMAEELDCCLPHSSSGVSICTLEHEKQVN